jgi:competence protein ComFC
MEHFTGFSCPTCGRRLPQLTQRCHTAFPFALADAAPYHNPVVRELIHTLKYRGATDALVPLTALLETYLGRVTLCLPESIIVPMPLHIRKERARGFNQSEKIACILVSVLSRQPIASYIPVLDTHALIRVKRTESQAELPSHEARLSNINGAFAVPHTASVHGKNIILVDDVFTTGATMHEAARVLKNAGAKMIVGVVVAKA